jgi:hypothetical protein
MDVRISDMTAWCRNDQCRKCDGDLRPCIPGSLHWFCICPCHGEPMPDYTRDGAADAYWQWLKSHMALEVCVWEDERVHGSEEP